MEDKNQIEKIKNGLKDLITKGGEITRKEIFQAEEISFNNFTQMNIKNVSYDEYGFLNVEDFNEKIKE
jgi:hypothetical protein